MDSDTDAHKRMTVLTEALSLRSISWQALGLIRLSKMLCHFQILIQDVGYLE